MKHEPNQHEREVARHLFNAVRGSKPRSRASREALEAIAIRLAAARGDGDRGSYAEGFQFAVELLKERIRVITEHALLGVATQGRRVVLGNWLEKEDPTTGENIYEPLKKPEYSPRFQEDLARIEAAFSKPGLPERIANALEKRAKEIMLQEHMEGSEDAPARGLADELWLKLGADRQGFYLAMASARNKIDSLERIRRVLFRDTVPRKEAKIVFKRRNGPFAPGWYWYSPKDSTRFGPYGTEREAAYSASSSGFKAMVRRRRGGVLRPPKQRSRARERT